MKKLMFGILALAMFETGVYLFSTVHGICDYRIEWGTDEYLRFWNGVLCLVGSWILVAWNFIHV